jgi:hypothetical protein
MPFIMPDDGLSDMNNVLVQRAGGMSLTTISQRLTPDEVMDKLEERVGPEGRMRTTPHSRVRTKEEAAHRRPL